MALKYDCIKCGSEVDDPGGLLLGPPDKNDLVKKEHLCVLCYEQVRAIISELFRGLA